MLEPLLQALSSAPLYKRVARGVTAFNDPGPKRKHWTEQNMEQALQDVTHGSLTIRRAALEHNVPKSTLHDRVSGKVLPGAVGGAPRYLNDEEEEELAKWLEGCAEIGCAKSVREVRAVVGAIVAKKHNAECAVVSHGWWDRFRARHPHLTLRAGESLAYVRAVSTNRTVLDKYFDLLEDVIAKNSLKEKPGRIFNLDESGLPLQHRPGRRIGIKGQKHVNVLTSGNKTNITILACVSASGFAIPPMVIYNRKNLTPELTRGEIPGTMYGLSTSGWIDSELFSEWFNRHFLQYAPSARPLLLLLDGHSSHYSPDFIYSACGNGVIVFCLPPHTTHLVQPLDATCFHSLKVYWDQACDDYMSCNPGKIVTIYQFSELFSKAWHQAMTPGNIVSAFRATGAFPVNRHAIVLPGERSASTPTARLAKKKGINYMPFYSPSYECHQKSQECTKFTEEEEKTFKTRYEEGYDLDTDTRYNLWLEINHPSSCVQLFASPETSYASNTQSSIPLSPSASPQPHLLAPIESTPLQSTSTLPEVRSNLSEYLPVPARAQKKTHSKFTGARVLTSGEHIRSMEEKQKKKEEAAEQKEKRRVEREQRRQERETIANKRKEKAAAKLSLGECKKKECKHPTARNWVCCKKCACWCHCICVGVKWSEAKTENYQYTCKACLI